MVLEWFKVGYVVFLSGIVVLGSPIVLNYSGWFFGGSMDGSR